MRTRSMNRRRNSGQVILIAVLAMALILLSTQVYVFEVQMSTAEVSTADLNDYIFAVKLGSRNVVVGSLANVSSGGSNNILATNLVRWASIVGRENQFGKSLLNYTVEDDYPFSSGVWLFWGNSGFGVSSGFANFTYELSDFWTDVNLSYYINITSTVLVQGTYRIILGDQKQLNITINLLNEGKPALAEQVTVYYRVLDSWLIPNASNDYALVDYGNGTYRASFRADIPSSSVEVSVRVRDQREILVQANVTCSQI
jgi:hypothetical protein